MDLNLLDTDLNSLKSVNVKPLRGIYFLYDNDELVYIGQSISIQRRVWQHFHGDSRIEQKSFNKYKFIEINEDESLDKIELLFILEYNPKYNKNFKSK
jgi:excinuclease UvrABC nuclease subunit